MTTPEVLTPAQRLMMALASPHPEVDDPSTAKRRAKRDAARAKLLDAMTITSPLILNHDWTPGSQEPPTLATNRAARRARNVVHARLLMADAKRKRPKSEPGVALRQALIEKHRAGVAKIYRGRIERAEDGIDRWNNTPDGTDVALRCHLTSEYRNKTLLAALEAGASA